jgi:hypothetical protein
MKFPIEFNGERVLATYGSHQVFSAVGDHLFPVPEGCIVQVCGWCARDGGLAMVLKEQGYVISHGVCSACDAKMREEAGLPMKGKV